MSPTTPLPRPRHLLAPLAVAGTLLALPAGAHADRWCGNVPSGGTAIAIVVERGQVTCSTARKVLRAYDRSKRPCSGSACMRRHHGWWCSSVYADFPRLIGCDRGNRRIGAYSLAD